MEAFALLCRTEGIIPAIESAHAIAGALEVGRELGPDGIVLVNLSGRGDKDVDTAARWFGLRAARERARRAVRPRRGPRAGPRWSATCRPGSRPSSGCVEALVAMVAAGVDVVEVGLPYSDPLMDGPTIQRAAEIALAPAPARPTCSRRCGRSRPPGRRPWS